jgi:hypothetical protein
MGRALPLRDFKDHELTVAIYWKKRTGIDSLQNGHAALILDTSHFNVTRQDDYVSWLSGGPGTTSRAGQHSYVDDAEQWGGIPAGNGQYHVPSRWVAVQGLDIPAMREAWDAARGKERAHWKLFDKNCATMVARIIKAGGGDNFARGGSKNQLWWWPTDIIRYCNSMRNHVYESSAE